MAYRNFKISNLRDIFKNYEMIGNESLEIDGLNFCNRNTNFKSIISFVTKKKYVKSVENNSAVMCLFIPKEIQKEYNDIIESRNGVLIISSNPEYDFYKLHEYLISKTDFYNNNQVTKIGNDCSIDTTAIIYSNVIIGNNVHIGPHTIIKSGVIICDNVRIGCNTIIGGDGFQIPKYNGCPYRVTHTGGVIIGESTSIGDNTIIDRSLFEGVTHIGKNCMIGHLVNISHNCYLGDGVVITPGVILCGSVTIKDNVWVGVNSSILNRVVINNNSVIGIGSVVDKDVAASVTIYPSSGKTYLEKLTEERILKK